MDTRYTPTSARKNLFQIIKDVNVNKSPVEIVPQAGQQGVAVIPLDDWRSIQETMYLTQCGVMDVVHERKADDSGFTSAADFNWDAV
jgi:prevent-host-death family protein